MIEKIQKFFFENKAKTEKFRCSDKIFWVCFFLF
jgi:hypothetical protein